MKLVVYYFMNVYGSPYENRCVVNGMCAMARLCAAD